MNVCVFCGSGTGSNPVYTDAAKKLGEALLNANATLVYGGGNIGLMGILADKIISGNGKVIGVIPDFLMKREVGHAGITQLEVVSSMHERKKRMADLSDCFIAMPGGWGTLDELAEILTWKQLGLISQPVGLLNVNFFFDSLVTQMLHMVKEGFLHPSKFGELHVSENLEKLLTVMGVVASR